MWFESELKKDNNKTLASKQQGKLQKEDLQRDITRRKSHVPKHGVEKYVLQTSPSKG